MKNELKQLLSKESELLAQVYSITRWAGALFCTSQMEELKQVREQIAILRSKK